MEMGANHPAMAQMAGNPKQRFRIVLLRLPGPSFFAVPSRLMAWILAKTNGWRKAGAEEKDYIQSHIDNVLSRGGLKKKNTICISSKNRISTRLRLG